MKQLKNKSQKNKQSSQKVGKKLKQTLLQRRIHAANKQGKDAQHHSFLEKRSQNQSLSPHTSQNGPHQKNLQTINAGEDVGKRELSCTVGENVN